MINFISGLITGGLIGVGIMCLLQINRDNKSQRRINNAIKYIKGKIYIATEEDDMFFEKIISLTDAEIDRLLEILGGDVDDE